MHQIQILSDIRPAGYPANLKAGYPVVIKFVFTQNNTSIHSSLRQFMFSINKQRQTSGFQKKVTGLYIKCGPAAYFARYSDIYGYPDIHRFVLPLKLKCKKSYWSLYKVAQLHILPAIRISIDLSSHSS